MLMAYTIIFLVDIACFDIVIYFDSVISLY